MYKNKHASKYTFTYFDNFEYFDNKLSSMRISIIKTYFYKFVIIKGHVFIFISTIQSTQKTRKIIISGLKEAKLMEKENDGYAVSLHWFKSSRKYYWHCNYWYKNKICPYYPLDKEIDLGIELIPRTAPIFMSPIEWHSRNIRS